ncbi:MAG: hypothetical protein NVS3B25_04060 [Hymenobacter sp.]
MTAVYHEMLAESFLLILAPGQAGDSEAALAHWLRCARRSGKPAVWVDCGLLNSLSDEATKLLWASHHELLEKHSQLVLVHVPDCVKRKLLDQDAGLAPCMVPTLLDAALQTHWQDLSAYD